jgi:hypothetical protein
MFYIHPYGELFGSTKRKYKWNEEEYSEGDHSDIQQRGMWQFYCDEFANFIVRPRI